MKYLALIWASLRRKRLRTLLTVMSVVMAFVLFGILGAVKQAFSLGVDVAGADRMLTIHKVSLIQPLPISYLPRIEQVEGVDQVAHATWFGGVYQDPKNFFAQMAVDPERYLDLYPEFVLPQEQKERWFAERGSAVVGRKTAERYGFEVGDVVPIQATIWQRADGADAWEFNVVGIYDGTETETDTTQFLFHWEYLDEARTFGKGMTGWYIERIADPEHSAEIAERIDALFANSPAETRTTTEKAFVQGFAEQIGDIGAITRWIVTAVLLILLLVVATTITQSVRERTKELAVLKTLGFRDGKILVMVLAESCFITLLGGVVGLTLSFGVVAALAKPLGQFLPVLYVPDSEILLGVGLMLALGLAAGALPALAAQRLRIAEALRRN
jgi:putative ABC transport system permease protein